MPAFAIFTTSCRRAIGVDRDVELLAERLELVDGGRTVDVAGDESGLPASTLSSTRELGAAVVVLPEP